MIICEIKDPLYVNITWRTTVLVATSVEDTGKVKVSLNMGL